MRVANKIYFQGMSSIDRTCLSDDEFHDDIKKQTLISKYLNMTLPTFQEKVKNKPEILKLECLSRDIMNKWNTRKTSLRMM